MLIAVFPNPRQLAALRRHLAPGDYTVLTHPDVPAGPAAGDDLRDVTSTDVRALLKDPAARLLCLHELGVYFLHSEEVNGELGFPAECLRAVTKVAMADMLTAAKLDVVPKEPFDLGRPPEPTGYPFTVKPDFGFASQLVYRITGPREWTDYLETARTPSAWPLRQSYGAAYYDSVPGLLDRFVREPDLSGLDFLSVPYLWDGDGATALPVSGLKAVATANTSFAWRGFRAPSGLDEASLTTLDTALERLSRHLQLRPGVYEVEALWGPDAGFLFLEFSPRPTGGLVPDLVHNAYGVDIDDLAVRAFLGHEIAQVRRRAAGSFLGLRRAEDEPAPEGRVVTRSVRRSATRVLVDEIVEVTA